MNISIKKFKEYMRIAWEQGKNDVTASKFDFWLETIYYTEIKHEKTRRL